MKKKLTKSQKNRMIAGVCGGLAEYFKIDPTIVRLIFVVFALLKGAGIPSQEYFDDDIDSMKSANCNENDTQSKEFSENKKSSESESNKIHTDEEFDSYFKK